jgi:hypothetical protein
VTATLSTLQHFVVAIGLSGQALQVGEMDYSMASTVKNATLRIDKIDTGDNIVLLKTAVSSTSKEYAFAFRPYSAFQLGVGGAGVVSFAKLHKYETVPVTGGAAIVDTQGAEHTAVNVAAMLSIVPNAFAASDFHPMFELGVGPASSLSIYAGLGVAYGKVFSLGGGFALAQVQELQSSETVGQILAASTDLKTSKHFVGGFYLHLTASANLSGAKSN